MIIREARLIEPDASVDVIALTRLRKEFFLFLKDSTPLYRDIESEIFGTDQRIQKSRRGEGFAVVFDLDGLSFALTADRPDSVVGAILCHPPK